LMTFLSPPAFYAYLESASSAAHCMRCNGNAISP
jgi:hypothetical protein